MVTGPNKAVGKPKTIQILKMLVPIILPTVISNSPFLADDTVIINSGSDVPMTMTVIVIILAEMLKYSATVLVEFTTMSLAIVIRMIEIIVKKMAIGFVYSGFSVSVFLNCLINLYKYKHKMMKNMIKIKASSLVKVLSKKRRVKVMVVISNRGSSLLTVVFLILTGLTMLAIPIIRRILIMQLPTTLEIVIS